MLTAAIRRLIVLVLVLAIPVIPFALWGDVLERWTTAWFSQHTTSWNVAGATIGLLATDVFLPIPSSMVSTFAGGRLGAIGGTMASWLGMSLGACGAFWLARWWGRSFVVRFSRPHERARMEQLNRRFGTLGLIIARPLPVLAEASVLLFGLQGLSWRRFLPAILISNLALASIYSAFGKVAARHHWLPLALCISLALPLLLAASFRIWWPQRGT